MICKTSNFSAEDCTFEEMSKKNLSEFSILCASADPLIKEGIQKRLNYQYRKLSHGMWGFIAHDTEGHVAGFIDVLPSEQSVQGIEGTNCYVIQCIYIRDDMQGKGLGRKLINLALERSRDRQGLAIIAYEDTELKPASFFEHIGFKEADKISALRLMWYANSEGPLPHFTWKKANKENQDGGGQNIRVEVVVCDSCPHAYRTGKIVQQLLSTIKLKHHFTIKRPEEKPAWRRLDILPNLFINNHLKHIVPMCEDEARQVLSEVFPELSRAKTAAPKSDLPLPIPDNPTPTVEGQ